jgi:hypothetical protein
VRRIVLSTALTAAFALAVALPAGADPKGGVQPACADITDASASYWDANSPGPPANTVTGRAKTAAPTCKNVDYTLWIAYASGGVLMQAQTTSSGNGMSFNGTGLVVFSSITGVVADGASGTQTVCVRFTSSRGRGDNVYDWAPDGSAKVTPYVDEAGQINCNGWGVALVDVAGSLSGYN